MKSETFLIALLMARYSVDGGPLDSRTARSLLDHLDEYVQSLDGFINDES